MIMSSPFIFDVGALLRGTAMPEQRTQTGPSPTRIGPEMIAIPEGGEVTVAALLTPLGGGIMPMPISVPPWSVSARAACAP